MHRTSKLFKPINNDIPNFLDINTSIRGILRETKGGNKQVKYTFAEVSEALTHDEIQDTYSYLIPTKRGRYLCLSGQCNNCPIANKCKKVEMILPYKRQLCAIDISSQEPMLAALVHREPTWITAQRNKNIRVLGMDVYLNEIANTLWGVTMENNNITIEDFNYYHFLQHIENDDSLLKALILFNEKGDKGEVTEQLINWWDIKFYQFVNEKGLK